MSTGTATRTHPDVIFVKPDAASGYGFTYLSAGDFLRAAENFMRPAVKATGIDAADAEQRRSLAYDYLWRYFLEPDARSFQRDNVRWIVAAAVREKYGADGPVPQVISIERTAEGGVTIRDAQEYLDHPGFPLAVIVGKPAKGGGLAHFFASRAAYEAAGAAGLSDDMWLPQIVYRLYAETPSVVMGLPRSGGEGKMAVECMALGFGRKANLVERAMK
ncbi:MAG: hypothetical protein SFV21_18620 [Rhodospirillaceae bacterium]|nr:hypothetical protein [Rhodospirillaceae bacterium]